MTRLGWLVLGVGVLTLFGCEGEDRGQAPPPRPPMTEEDKAAMPPEARAAMENAMKAGQKTAEQKAAGQ